ncbi:MAG: hypothetical protein Q4C60_11850 [Eubacteriales bacterium]|nr:hypothetical protein [Eubacteriales bacterium]
MDGVGRFIKVWGNQYAVVHLRRDDIFCVGYIRFFEAGFNMEADGKMEILPCGRALGLLFEGYKNERRFICAVWNYCNDTSIYFR